MYTHTGVADTVAAAAAAAAPFIAEDRARYAAAQTAALKYAAEVWAAANAPGGTEVAPLYLAGENGLAALGSADAAAASTAVASTAVASTAAASTAADAPAMTAFEYEFYTTDGARHAAALAQNILAASVASGDDFIVAAEYDSKRGRFFVEIDARHVAYLWPLPLPPRNAASVRSIVAPVIARLPVAGAAVAAITDTQRAGNAGKAGKARKAADATLAVPCVPPELRLYDVYRALGDPSRAEEWPALLRDEIRLFALAGADIQARVALATSGGAPPRREQSRLEQALLQLAAGKERALVGARAVNALEGSSDAGGLIQIVSGRPAAAEGRAIVAAAKAAGARVDVRSVDVGMPLDPELRRMKVYRMRGSQRAEPIMDVFNAAEYGLVPLAPTETVQTDTGAELDVKTDTGAEPDASETDTGAEPDATELELDVVGGRAKKKKPKRPRTRDSRDRDRDREKRPAGMSAEAAPTVGAHFAVLRFLVADLWTAMVLYQRGVVDGERARALIHRIFGDITAVRSAAAAAGVVSLSAILPTQPTRYIGQHVDYAILERQRMSSGRRGVRGFPLVIAAEAAVEE